ncbi:bifunctional adenosylcobinamide kinase/adenosylcobinamide-phosphate guanylyltransferase [Cognatishimia sp. F0-27]|uniref:bifunctional adenosylcobinamide kinase/adenosylcobinamide-phosphate guanylyltransferase n=1 Tax=Cognatishimia sp. F0-27 TaxID=2816855 RepID=UPI001D0C4B6A|nr:bifunctional adenosylcobinamide kinase/adenosylcobinamide-phosphate guanylyltransferase [Cognatishimia sp. F0-27]MCC1493283.1 bifunctional adenosylcobinamide kinase/adenosylcobinamide-phosphate guanylyltransferase [Cognatishimia sp. F0-27]
MVKSILITGGARSGKSALAERRALRATGRAVYIATAQDYGTDPEMTNRIAAHQARRGPEWRSVAAPIDLSGALNATDEGDPRLVDCLTLWLTNLMLADQDWRAETERLLTTLAAQNSLVLFVTNEVGSGIVPENRLAREFRDAAGWMNQTVGARCDEIWLAVAGHPLKVKPDDPSF